MPETVKGIERYTRRPGPGGEGGGSYYRIRCRYCTATFEHKARKYSGPPPDLEDEVLPEAKKAGWDVLHGARRAVCPGCLERSALTKAKKEAKIMVTKPAVPAARVPAVNSFAALGAVLIDAAGKRPSPTAEAPRSMGFDEKRIVIAKLQDVYVDHKTGYDRGWSDKRVAEDLGVPRAWVAEVREANFGPARDNDEVREVLAEARTVLAASKDLTEQALKVEEQYVVFDRARSEVMAQISRLERRLSDVEKAVA